MLHISILMQFYQGTLLNAGSGTGQKEDLGGQATGQEHWQALLLGTPAHWRHTRSTRPTTTGRRVSSPPRLTGTLIERILDDDTSLIQTLQVAVWESDRPTSILASPVVKFRTETLPSRGTLQWIEWIFIRYLKYEIPGRPNHHLVQDNSRFIY